MYNCWLFCFLLFVIAGLTRNLLSKRESFLRGGLRMFLRNDGKARDVRSRPRVTEDNQKTKGFNRKAEKNTSLSLAEKKWGIFRAVK